MVPLTAALKTPVSHTWICWSTARKTQCLSDREPQGKVLTSGFYKTNYIKALIYLHDERQQCEESLHKEHL